MGTYKLTMREGKALKSGANLSDVFENWKGKDERWLFVAPHDDDLCLGCGLLMLKALEEKIPLHVVITSDGGMGYGSTTPKEQIVEGLQGIADMGLDGTLLSWPRYIEGIHQFEQETLPLVRQAGLRA